MKRLLLILIPILIYAQSGTPISTRPDQIKRSVKITSEYLGISDSTLYADLFWLVNWSDLDTTTIADNVDTLKQKLTTLLTYVDQLEGYVNGLEDSLGVLNGKVSTSANQTTIIGHVDGIEGLITTLNGYVDQLEGYVDEIETKLTSLDGKDYATSSKQDVIETTLNSIETLITTLNGYVDGLEGYLDGVETSLTAIDSNTDRNTTGGQGIQTVTTSATALPSQATKVVWLENQNSSGNIYYGFSNGVTISNGRLLSPMTAVKIETDNLSDIYVIANSSLTIRYSYQN
jgi:hypothetical protein